MIDIVRTGLPVARRVQRGDRGNRAQPRRELIIQVQFKQVDVIHNGVVVGLPLCLVDRSNIVLVGVVDAIAGGNRKSVYEVGSRGMGDRCGVGGIETRDDGLGRVGSYATLRLGNGLQAEEGDKQRGRHGRAPQQDIFILFSPNQKERADLKRFLGDLPQGWEEPV